MIYSITHTKIVHLRKHMCPHATKHNVQNFFISYPSHTYKQLHFRLNSGRHNYSQHLTDGITHWSQHITYIYIYIYDFKSLWVILINNQTDAALSSRLYYSLRNCSTCFGCSLHPSSGVH